jgi:hypothetical protein
MDKLTALFTPAPHEAPAVSRASPRRSGLSGSNPCSLLRSDPRTSSTGTRTTSLPSCTLSLPSSPSSADQGRTLSPRPSEIQEPAAFPSSVPHVDELGVTSAPLKSAAFFLSTFCKDYSDDFMLCKEDNQDPTACLKEGRRVTRCAQDLSV